MFRIQIINQPSLPQLVYPDNQNQEASHVIRTAPDPSYFSTK